MAEFISPFLEGARSIDGAEVGIGNPTDLSIPTNINGGDVSGGTASPPAAAASEQIEEFAAEGGGVLALAYGEHFIAGHLIVHKFTLGTPNVSKIMVALGEGQGGDGGHGEWDSAVAVYYAGEALSVSPDGSTAGYRFYKGFISTGAGDVNQPIDGFLTGGLAYSGTPYIAAKLPDATANAEDRPDKLRGRYKCRKTFDFDSVGRISPITSYSTNPARVAADVILRYYERKFPGDASTPRRRLQDKIDWESWAIWRDYNDGLITWDNGTSIGSIKRFECNWVTTGDKTLAQALDEICATAGAHWQEDGEKIIFLPPTERAPEHHFDESNIIAGSVRIDRRDLRDRPNYFSCDFRDYDDTYMGLSSTEVRRDALIRQVGAIKTARALPPMKKSQADRLLDRQARLEADNPVIVSLIGDETSIDVLEGDFVTFSHPLGDWDYQRFLVTGVNLIEAENGPDTCEFTLQQIDDILYSDIAHGPRQEALTP